MVVGRGCVDVCVYFRELVMGLKKQITTVSTHVTINNKPFRTAQNTQAVKGDILATHTHTCMHSHVLYMTRQTQMRIHTQSVRPERSVLLLCLLSSSTLYGL